MMTLSFEEKLLKIFDCIEKSCNSSVRIFDRKKGHSSRSVGFAAYEERQQQLKKMAEDHPEVIEFLCKKSGHYYFKFEGKTIKIISSIREELGKNVFEKNAFEKGDEFKDLDHLLRIIYSANYDLEANEAVILECYYLEIDRNTNQVKNEINLLELAKGKDGYITEVVDSDQDSVELPESGLLKKSTNVKADSIDE